MQLTPARTVEVLEEKAGWKLVRLCVIVHFFYDRNIYKKILFTY